MSTTSIPATSVVEVAEALLPTPEDVAFYGAHGWWASDVVLDDGVLDAAMSGAERFHRGERDFPLPVDDGYSDWTEGDTAAVRNNEFASLQNRELAALVRQPVIGAIAARLAGTTGIRLFDDQLVYKPAGIEGNSTVVGWHTDHAYWGTCTSDKMLTAWIPFHDVTIERSPVVVIDGSHKWPDLEHTRFFTHTDLGSYEEAKRAEGLEVETVPIVLKKGQISFHSCWTLHASLPNRSDLPRVALAVHLQDVDNRYRRYLDPSGREVHLADEAMCRRLPNGDPDFSDPAVFPLIWGTDPQNVAS